MNTPAKIISVFSHKGGVGKTTFVYNMAFVMVAAGKKVLLIDADSQMNLTASIFGRFLSVDYSANDYDQADSDNEVLGKEWRTFCEKYRTFEEHFRGYASVDEDLLSKNIYVHENNEKVHLLAGSLSLDNAAMAWTDIVLGPRSAGAPRDPRLVSFQKSIRGLKSEYDYILIDTSPSASNIINAMSVCSSDYFVVPTFPNFFSMQAVNNLQDILERWDDLFDKHKSSGNYAGFDIKTKFLGVLLQKASPMNKDGGSNQHTKATIEWTNNVNGKIKTFCSNKAKFAVSEEGFSKVFPMSEPWIINRIRNFPPDLENKAVKKRVPLLCLNDGDMSQKHKEAFRELQEVYNDILSGFDKLP